MALIVKRHVLQLVLWDLFIHIVFIFIYVYICIYAMCVGMCRGKGSLSDLLEPKLQVVVSYHVGAEN